MNRLAAILLASTAILLPSAAFSAAFEDHTSWQKEPRLETAKGVSLGKSVLEMGMGFRFLHSTHFFNTQERISGGLYWEEGKEKLKNSYYDKTHDIFTWDIFWRFGFTDNWTVWGNIPFVWSSENQFAESSGLTGGGDWKQTRAADMEVGDCEAGLLYQFFRRSDPTVSMGLSLRWKLPTGNEAPGEMDVNITGTGTTDVELSFLGRWQLLENFSLGWSAGYNIRFPGAVQYLMDNHTGFTNALVDLGDEIFLRGEGMVALDYVALHLAAEFRYRMGTEVALPDFRAETVRWINPLTGRPEEETYLLHNGARYQEWGVRDLLNPHRPVVSSAGYLLTVVPRLIFRPLDWLDLSAFVKLHLAGKNSVFLTDRDGDNPSFSNFMPMQALGFNSGGVIVGELGGHLTVRW